MSRKQEIEKAINKVFKRQSAFGDEDRDAAKITQDDDLKMKGNIGRGKIKMQQGIDEDEKWGGKIVNSEKAFNQLSEESSNDENDSSDENESQNESSNETSSDENNENQSDDSSNESNEEENEESENEMNEESEESNENEIMNKQIFNKNNTKKNKGKKGNEEEFESEEFFNEEMSEDNGIPDEDDIDDEMDEEEDDNEEEDEADKLIQQTLQMETVQKRSDDVDRKCVKNQLDLYKTALDIRVKMQGIVSEVNSFPIPEDLNNLKENDENIQNELKELEESFEQLFTATANLSHTIDSLSHFNWNCPFISTSNEKKESEKSFSMTEKFNQLKSVTKSKDEKRLTSLEKWHSKTSVLNLSKSSQHQNGIVQQINAIMKDEDRLWRRTNQLRGNKIYLSEDLHSSTEIFDDGDFYQQLIKDAMDGSFSSTNTNAMQNNTNRKRQQKKKRVNLDIVFPKLENFKTPVEYNEELLDIDRSILINNLFK